MSPFVLASGVLATKVLTTVAVLALAAGCGGSGKKSVDGVSGSGATLRLNEVGNGFGQLLPHRVAQLDALGNPTGQIITIRTIEDVVDNVQRGNPALPPTVFQPAAVAPDGQPGNHFLFANFTQVLDPFSVLNPSPSNSGLSGAASVTTINPVNGVSLPADGRAFLGGKTLVGPATGSPPALQLVQYVEQNIDPVDPRYGQLRPVLDEAGLPLFPEAEGFPGVLAFVPNATTLLSDNTITFVADLDNDLTTFETFPSNVQIRFRVTTALRAQNGERLESQVLASATVDLDVLPPEIITTPPPTDAPLITPGNGDIDVDPQTNIRIEFTESVQPYSVGAVLGAAPPTTSSALQILFGPSTSVTTMPFNAVPISPFDFSTYELVPGFAFPGRGPEFQSCGTFSRVDVNLLTNAIEDLSQVESTDPNTPGVFEPNRNLLGASTFFETGEGPGLVNAPAAPDTIYVGRGGAQPGISIIDLNGFGQTTGNPVSSQPFPLEGESRFPYDPNVTQNAQIRPLLVPGECTLDGGSAGVFTLVRDTALEDIVVRSPLISAVTDAHIGRALDRTFRNGPPPFGCQSGGGNVCALDGLKVIASVLGNQPNTVAPAQVNQFGAINPGYENIISWSPHPNPPRLAFPPQCVTPFLAGNEPSSIDSPGGNFLVSGNPFPIPSTQTPPSGLLTPEQNQFFLGPSFGQTQAVNCSVYQIRQQVGHFLYVADRPRSEIVVFNSNRLTVIERIPVADPTSLAMGPNIDVLAVSNQVADTVTFIDINPQSAQFHQVIRTIQVGNSPRGLAFEPSNEDLLVCNELDSTISVVAAGTLDVRRTLGSQLNRPFEVCVTPRMTNFSFQRGVYFAHVMNRTGSVALMESGPNGVNGWGFDDIIGIIPFTFRAPKTLQIDPLNLDASVYIVHEGPIDVATGTPGDLGIGAISRLRIESGLIGVLPLQLTGVINPNFRDVEFNVPVSISQSNGQLSGIPIDIAFDNQRNLGAIPGPATNFSAGSPIPANHKGNTRVIGPVSVNTSEPQFLFASVPNPIGGSGVVDVLALALTGLPRFDTNPYQDGIQSIPVPQVTLLSDYWRQ
ncbi:MAG: beta-propeller fold lactonase family protein [Planctomycetota bacterium]